MATARAQQDSVGRAPSSVATDVEGAVREGMHMDDIEEATIHALVDDARHRWKPYGRPVLDMKDVECAELIHGKKTWLAYRASQNPSCARLLEVAVVLRGERNVPVLAILTKPQSTSKRAKLPKPDYIQRYQAAAWHGLGVAFVADDDGKIAWSPVSDEARIAGARESFDAIVADVVAQLDRDRADKSEHRFWMPCADSGEAEGLVRISVHRALSRSPHHFVRTTEATGPARKGYQGFWRGAKADGVWHRPEAEPKQVALEVKLHEDAEAPLCQVVDHVAHAGAVIHVRVGVGSAKVEPEARKALDHAMKQLEDRLLIKYIQL